MSKRELWELQSMQSAPLAVKISLTKARLREWINEFGEDGVYVSFSGGKDSTVLLDIVRKSYPNIPAVFVDVPTQYPELREFAKTWKNVEIIKPKISFMEVCEKYGFPLISKEVSQCVEESRKWLDKAIEKKSALTDRQTDRQTVPYADHMADLLGIDRRKNKENPRYQLLKKGLIPSDTELFEYFSNDKYEYGLPVIILQLYGKVPHKEKGIVTNEYSTMYDKSKYRFFLGAPFDISNKCCAVMKKDPLHKYAKETGRVPITAQMASESKLRTSQWIKHGCNAFDSKSPISNPMSFWTEQDVLLYIKQNNLPICSVYGDIVEDITGTNEVEGQLTISDLEGMEDMGIFDAERLPLKTTGCSRTGCMLCGFGCHLEKEGEGRFEMLKKTHPKMYNLLDVVKNNGVTFREAVEWVNEHGNLNIRL